MRRIWPSQEDIKALVDAAAGLFVYAATVLRFVDRAASIGPEEALYVAIAAISKGDPDSVGSHLQPFTELDAFYLLIVRRIPDDILPSTQLLLSTMLLDTFDNDWSAIYLSNRLGFSETKFRLVCNELHAVLRFQDRLEPLVPENIDPTRPFHHAGFEAVDNLDWQAHGLGGTVSLYHKSFYDFLRDPARSGIFCVTSPAAHNHMFKHYLQRHFELDRAYSVQGKDLILGRGLSNSAASLSWPYFSENEYVNSFLKTRAYNNVLAILAELSYSAALDPQLLMEFVNVDFRKSLLNNLYLFPEGGLIDAFTHTFPSLIKRIGCTLFIRIPTDDGFDYGDFKQATRIMEERRIIRPYSSDLTSWYKKNFRRKSQSISDSGLFIRGRGAKKTFWYWEYNPEVGLHEFETTNLSEAKELYQKEGFRLWDSALELQSQS